MTKRKTDRHVQFRVSFPLPPYATVQNAQAYVEAAVSSWYGSLKPPGRDPEDPDGDPMFDLDTEAISVTRIRATRRQRYYEEHKKRKPG